MRLAVMLKKLNHYFDSRNFTLNARTTKYLSKLRCNNLRQMLSVTCRKTVASELRVGLTSFTRTDIGSFPFTRKKMHRNLHRADLFTTYGRNSL